MLPIDKNNFMFGKWPVEHRDTHNMALLSQYFLQCIVLVTAVNSAIVIKSEVHFFNIACTRKLCLPWNNKKYFNIVIITDWFKLFKISDR